MITISKVIHNEVIILIFNEIMTSHLLASFLNMNMISADDAVTIFLIWRLPRYMDRGGIQWSGLHILWIARHCMHILTFEETKMY